jgi:ABC-2 type transport system permease protein
MRIRWKSILSTFFREIHIFTHDIDILVIALLAPFFYSIFYGTLYLQKTEHNVDIVVVDADRSTMSKMFTRSLDANQFIHVKDIITDLGTAQEKINSFDAQGVVFIPDKFEASLKSGKGSDIKVYLNTTRFLVSNDLNKGITTVALTMGAGVRLKYFESKGYSYKQAMEMIEPLNAEIKPMFNTTETYGDFLIPAILALIIQQTLMIAVAESFAKERENSSLGNLYEHSEQSISNVIFGKGLIYFIFFAAYSFFFFTTFYRLYSLPFRGSALVMALLTLLFVTSVLYLAIFVGSFFKRKMIAIQVLGFTSYPIFFVTGYSWPMAMLPVPLKILGQVFPVTPYLSAMTRVTLMGAGFGDILPELFHLLLLLIAGIGLAYWRVEKIVEEEIVPEQKTGD